MSEYSGDEIRTVSAMWAIRHRPGMYIGSTDSRGLHHLAEEPIQCMLSEWTASACTYISLELLPDGGCCIRNDGPGIPVDFVPPGNQRLVETVLTSVCVLKGGAPWATTSHYGVGLPALNALSTKLIVRIVRDGFLWEQEYRQGVPTGPLEQMCESSEGGTSITFWPDREIFGKVMFDAPALVDRLREMSFLYPGICIRFRDRRPGNESDQEFCSPAGAVDFLNHVNRDESLHPAIRIRREEGDLKAEAALQWVKAAGAPEHLYACGFATTSGGTHLKGLRHGLKSAIRRFVPPGSGSISHEAIGDGLRVVLSVWLPEPKFISATRTSLGNPEMESFVARMVHQGLTDYLESHRDVCAAILDRIGFKRN